MSQQERAGAAPRPTIRDVAALAGVSNSAVSKALHGNGRISSETARRIREASEALGWTPHLAASGLRSLRSRAVALVISRPADLLGSDPHFTALISGIEAELAPRGYGLLLQLIGDTDLDEAQVYRRLAHGRSVDGVLLTDGRVDDPRFALVAELGLPYVLIGQPARPDVEHVSVPEPGAGLRDAVALLVDLGHRRIASVTGPVDRAHTVLRRAAVEEALAGHGLALTDVIATDFSPEQAVAATDRLLAAHSRPTAVFYANDSMALCGMGAIQRRGLRVPEDVSVVGYDDLPMSRWLQPGLTTVDQHVAAVGQAAARSLLRQVGTDAPEAVLDTPPVLVVRGSTGPPEAR
ncbi:LacI family DNA-binding transcriptional regulator [Pseudonocardia sp. MH-G8]|uniref:LacI family DNA-binding transcriptional regulator n=1 Tax=Pseudonocardia sp. MH-G8 TaxID=1854588 RepID=UPI0018E91D1F|nr:LacI family DNA-binding transcriptional regulator [Pseudonocardia sp. MH-G8]